MQLDPLSPYSTKDPLLSINLANFFIIWISLGRKRNMINALIDSRALIYFNDKDFAKLHKILPNFSQEI